MALPGSGYELAIRQQLAEQRNALAEIESLIKSTDGVSTEEFEQVFICTMLFRNVAGVTYSKSFEALQHE